MSVEGTLPLERDHVALLSEADMGSRSPDLLVPELSSLEKGAQPLQELDPEHLPPREQRNKHIFWSLVPLSAGIFLMLMRTY